MVQRRRRRPYAGCELGHSECHVGARSRCRLDHEAVVIAVDLAQASVDVAQTNRVLAGLAGEHCTHHVRVGPDAIILDDNLGLGAIVACRDADVPDAFLGLEPVTDRVLHQRLDREERPGDGQHLGRNEE